MTNTPKTPGTSFTDSTVEADGLTIRYFEAGTGDPLVVLHGGGGPQFSFALDFLAERFRVIQFEIPGFGGQPDNLPESFSELADIIDNATGALGLDTYSLLGTSFGGIVSTHLALNRPERLSALVLEAPGTFRVGAVQPGPDMGLSWEDLVRAFRSQPEREPAFQPPDPEAMAKAGPTIGRLMGSASEYDEKLVERLSECTVRTLVMFGEDDGIVPPDNGRTFLRAMPDCSFVILSRAAHDVQNDRPEDFAELVGDFLTNGSSFRLPEESTLATP